jgi:hypothetical protein
MPEVIKMAEAVNATIKYFISIFPYGWVARATPGRVFIFGIEAD